MNINLNNYEAYFLDYHEGSLSPTLVKELKDFISKHPELREELESFEPLSLQDIEGIKYEDKKALKKQQTGINSSNFDEFAIEYIEGTLSTISQQGLKSFISKNPSYKKDLELYEKTKLTPDTSIVFDDKYSLKKQTKRPAAYYYWSAAASVAIIIGAYFMFNTAGTPNENIIVNHEQKKDSNVIANHIAKSINTVIPQTTPIIPAHNAVKNNSIAIKTQHSIQHGNKNVIPTNISKDSSIIAENIVAKNTVSPGDTEDIPDEPENIAVTPQKNMPDTTINSKPIKYNFINPAQQEVATIKKPKENKKRKFLIFLAKLTCKGLHEITGQHIELKEQYASDTTNVVAYQLDLGKRKIQFPVKKY